MFKLLFSVILVLSLMLVGCKNKLQSDQGVTDAFAESVHLDTTKNIVDEFIFLGESTTYHLKSRGVLSGGTQTTQVWAPRSGTLMLEPSTYSCRIIYPETGEELELDEALRRKRPKYILLTFGLNGAAKSISKGADYFKSCYSRLISAINSASPQTVVILQSCFPIGKNMDMSSHSVNSHTLNGYIDTINGWTRELAQDLSVKYFDTAPLLKDSDGFLKKEFQAEDGYHLTRDAYLEILKYIKAQEYGG